MPTSDNAPTPHARAIAIVTAMLETRRVQLERPDQQLELGDAKDAIGVYNSIMEDADIRERNLTLVVTATLAADLLLQLERELGGSANEFLQHIALSIEKK